jgi:carboxymuconolactone decarboxylase family protein
LGDSDDKEKRGAGGEHGASGSASSGEKREMKIRVHEDAEAQGEVLEAYDFWRKGSGRKQVPGIIKCFGARPDFLKKVIEFGNTVHFSPGHLERRQKELIASYVSFLNKCDY